jgi:hypothetical protein
MHIKNKNTTRGQGLGGATKRTKPLGMKIYLSLFLYSPTKVLKLKPLHTA